ncbi:hypothetical protein ACRAWD_04510 [Caulobacter segnis]
MVGVFLFGGNDALEHGRAHRWPLCRLRQAARLLGLRLAQSRPGPP